VILSASSLIKNIAKKSVITTKKGQRIKTIIPLKICPAGKGMETVTLPDIQMFQTKNPDKAYSKTAKSVFAK